MIQINPAHRLGSTLESIDKMKTHPFFEGVDFKEVSRPEYTGLKELVTTILPRRSEIFEDISRLSQDSIHGLNNAIADDNKCVMSGNLCKKNWYGNK